MKFKLAYFEGAPVASPGRDPFQGEAAKLRWECFTAREAAMAHARRLSRRPRVSHLVLYGDGDQVVLDPGRLAEELRAPPADEGRAG